MRAIREFDNLFAIFGTIRLNNFYPFKNSTQFRDKNTQVDLILTIQRYDNAPGYIGGKVEQGEYWIDALVREFWEEVLIEPWMLQDLTIMADSIPVIVHESLVGKRIGFLWWTLDSENYEHFDLFFSLYEHIHQQTRYSDEVFGVSITPIYKEERYVKYNNNLLKQFENNRFALAETTQLTFPYVSECPYRIEDIVLQEPEMISKAKLIEACDRIAVMYSGG